MNFEMNVNVTIGVTSELATLAKSFLRGNFRPAEIGPAPQPAPDKHEETQAPVQPAEAIDPVGDMPEEVFYPSEEDVRAAMDRTRKRIEGEDYKTNTASEAYAKYHKRLTAAFKSIAAQLGADRPSTLPREKRGEFIDTCTLLVLAADGELVAPTEK